MLMLAFAAMSFASMAFHAPIWVTACLLIAQFFSLWNLISSS